MEFEISPSQHIAPELQFITFEAVDDLRKQQDASVLAAEMQVAQAAVADGKYASNKSLKEARESAETHFSEPFEDFLAGNLDRGENTARYEAISSLLQSFSLSHMGNEKWLHGDIGADGKNDFTTSGRYQLQQALESLSEPSAEADAPQEVNPIDHTSPEAQAAYAAVTSARNQLAKLSVARRQLIRKGGKKATTLTAQYNEARTAYGTALENVTAFYVTAYHDRGADDQSIREKVLPRLIDEHHSFTQAEFDILKTDDSLRGRTARYLGKRGAMFGLSAGSGVAIGLAARAISKTALMAGIGITGGAAAGGLIAARYTKNILLTGIRNSVALNKEFEKRRAQDTAALKSHLETTASTPLDVSIRSVHAKIGAVITDRVEKDRISNRNRVAVSALIGGVAATAAEFGPDLYHDVFGSSHGSAAAPETTSTPPSATSSPAAPVAPLNPTGGPTTIEIPNGSVVIGGTPSPNIGSFNPQVLVEPGHGYILEIQDMAAQNGDQLSITQATDAYHHVLDSQGANFFTDDQNYVFNGDNRISRPGFATWDHAHLTSLQEWLTENEKNAA